MGKDTYAPRSYKCECGKIQKHYVWSSEIEETRRACDNSICKLTVGVENLYNPVVDVPGLMGAKMTPAEVHKERKARSVDHFKKEIYTDFTAGSMERKHFSKKHGWKS